MMINIVSDPSPLNPRDNDCVAQLWCWHRRYRLGDVETRPNEFLRSEDDVLNEVLSNGKSVLAIKPLFLLDHGDLHISTKPYNDRWDSGRIGWAIVTSETAEQEGIKEDPVAWAERMIDLEVAEYAQYLSGDVWGFVVYPLTTEGMADSARALDISFGFYGVDAAEAESRNCAESMSLGNQRARASKLKQLIKHRVPLDLRGKLLPTL